MNEFLTTARTRPTTVIVTAVMVVLALAPLLNADVYTAVVLTSVLGYALLAMAINLMAGHAGLLTLAHCAYAGVGGYASVLASRHLTHNGFIQLLIAILAGAAVAALTGWIAVRASKTYFLMLSLAIGELLHILVQQWRSVTRGSDGLSAGAPFELTEGNPVSLSGYVYWVAFVVFLVFAGLILLVVRSPFGSALRGIRDNEPRMRGLGYPTARYKYLAWIFSGFVAGAAGWIMTVQLPRFVEPAQLSFHMSGLMLLAVVIGGLGSMWGACVGATAVYLMTTVVTQDLGGHGPLVLGLIFVIAVYLLPRGLAGLRLPARRQRSSSREEGSGEQEPAEKVTV